MRKKGSNFKFDVLFYPQYKNESGQVICYPGSVFEGIVNVKVSVATPVHQVKLVFKASEKINHDAMGWEKPKKQDDRLFAVRTILWGLPSGGEDDQRQLPILEPGDYRFPFICQMPYVNFPPSFRHALVNISYGLVVCVKLGDGKDTPIMSECVPVYFSPMIETLPIKHIDPFKQEIKLTQHTSARVEIPRLAFSIHELHKDEYIPIKIYIISPYSTIISEESHHQQPVSQIRVCLKRYYHINYKTFSKTEMTIISQQDFLPPHYNSAISVRVPLSLKQSTFCYSPYLSIEYRLIISVKIRYGLVQIRKKIWDYPITLGTLPVGICNPAQLKSYSNICEGTSILESKPHFIRPNQQEPDEFLPAYDSESLPPDYTTIANFSNINRVNIIV